MASTVTQVENELQAIEAVLGDDYALEANCVDQAYSHCFTVRCVPSSDADDCLCSVRLRIKIPNAYPSAVPTIHVIGKDGISDSTVNNLLLHLRNRLTKKLNEEMLYDIIELSSNYLDQYNFIGASVDETPKADADADASVQANNDDDEFDDDDAGWDDDDEFEDDATLAKSLASIAIKENDDAKTDNAQKPSALKFELLSFESMVRDSDVNSAMSGAWLAVMDAAQLAMGHRHCYAECRKLSNDAHDMEVRIGVQMSHFVDNETLLRVLGFEASDFLVIVMRFSADYIYSSKPPQIVEVGKSVPHKNNHHNTMTKVRNKLQPIVGSHSILNRLKNKLLVKLWRPPKVQQFFPPKYTAIMQLMHVTSASYAECRKAMAACKNDYEKALSYVGRRRDDDDDESVPKESVNKTAEIRCLCNELRMFGHDEIYQQKPEQKLDDDDDDDALAASTEFESAALDKFVGTVASSFRHNILSQILYFAIYSAVTLNKRCLVCDVPHPSGCGQFMKPTACDNQLCMYGYSELEIGLDIASAIKDRPETIDLLITFFYVAVKKGNEKTLRYHSPKYVHADPPNEHVGFGIRPTKSDGGMLRLDVTKLREEITKIPSIDTLLMCAKKGNAVLKKALARNAKSNLLWPLLRWLIGSDRSYLIPLRTREEQFDGLPSCFQFKFVSYSPEREHMFSQLSIRNGNCGTLWAWHGSPIECWHSILRTGLKNMSGRRDMRHGAAFGSGIYLAKNSGTSYWYSDASRSDTWPLSMFNRSDYYGRTLSNNMAANAKRTGHGLYCLALCEILNHPKLKPTEPSYYVVPTEQWVMIRYLFVFNTVDNKFGGNWHGIGKYFNIEASKLMDNYRKKQRAQN